MAVTQVKRSIHRTQPSRLKKQSAPGPRHAGIFDTQQSAKPKNNRQRNQKRSFLPLRRLVQFPQAKGKLVEDVEFSTAAGYHNISINFQDKTCLNFAIETSFTVESDYSDWKTGNQRILRAWRPIPSFKS